MNVRIVFVFEYPAFLEQRVEKWRTFRQVRELKMTSMTRVKYTRTIARACEIIHVCTKPNARDFVLESHLFRPHDKVVRDPNDHVQRPYGDDDVVARI